MATIVKNLGPVTAYAYAKAGGYAGTEEEFQALLEQAQNFENRVVSKDGTKLVRGTVIEAVGIPVYISDVTAEEYADYGLTETGWYVFAQINAKAGVTAVNPTVEGGTLIETGENYVCVAVRFKVAAESQPVTVTWAEGITETYIFKATDLAIRNLDYRTTFYVYDAASFVTWEYAIATDATFSEDKAYFLKSGSTYAKATVTIGDPVPKAYYEHSYELTTDETFQTGKVYYTESEDVYTQAEVTPGDAVTPDTYYVDVYTMTEDTAFVDGKTYYTLSGTTYSEATVTAGEAVPTLYYVHSKCIISGMARNITYKFDELIDCPMEFILPEIEDETHGCWFEIRCLHAGEYSMTLTPPSADVKIATEHTQKETKGINMIDLHYSDLGGNKVWRFMNTHSSFTADTSPLVSIAFRKPPTTTAYTVGDTLATAGAEIVATYEDGHTKLVTATFTPANGATLTAEDITLTASYTEGDVTATATTALTITEGA